MTRGFRSLVSAVDFLVDLFGPFSLKKKVGKNPPKNPPKNPRISRDLFDQKSTQGNFCLETVDTEFPCRVPIVDRGTMTPFPILRCPFRGQIRESPTQRTLRFIG